MTTRQIMNSMNIAQHAAPQLPTVPQPVTLHQAEENPATPRSVDWNNPRVSAILEAAAKCFARKGFSATTLAEIGKELGLRKSIVHYYFASKAALIHEVQSFTYHKYLSQVHTAMAMAGPSPLERAAACVQAMWSASTEDNVGLNIEVWSSSRNDDELKRRASALQLETRKLVRDALNEMLGPDTIQRMGSVEPVCTLMLGVLNGLSVSQYLGGDPNETQRAYEIFLKMLRLAAQSPEAVATAV